MVRLPPVHVVLQVDTADLQARLAELQAAEARYLALVRGELDCPAVWPHDQPHPGYVGTRCRLLEGHAQRDGTRHRNGPVEWKDR